MSNNKSGEPFRGSEKEELKKKIHRALVEARTALYQDRREEARAIVYRIMAEAAPAARRAASDGAFNWVVEELKPLDELLLPEDD